MLWAAQQKNLQMVQSLVNSGASLLKGKKDGINIMHLSAGVNDIHTLDYVLQERETTSVDIPNEEVFFSFNN